MSNRQERLKLIQAVEKSRESKLITYITGDRRGIPGQISSDAVRPMYNHVRALGFEGVPRIDLFLYSQGGDVNVPWRLVTMLRQYCQELNVLIPYKAHSAATLISIGADRIVMSKKGELGPIDPILTRTEQGEQTAVVEQINVEDIMAFVAFLKERAGLGDQAALSSNISILIQQLSPWALGSIYRTHSHIRLIARNLLTSHKETLEERQINLIVETLAEKIYSHGHAIGREEAIEIGLPIEKPDAELEDRMWQLLEMYESMMNLDYPIDPKGIIPPGKDEHKEDVILACIESEAQLNVFRGELRFHHIRKLPPQLNMNLNIQLQLPPHLKPEELPAEAPKVIQEMLNGLRDQIAPMVQAELNKQAPIERTKGDLLSAYWQDATNDGI